MIIAGCDIGSLTAKAVIMKDEEIMSSAVIRAKTKPGESADVVFGLALEQACLSRDNIEYIVGTGYGKEQITFANSMESEISCHAKGTWKLMPSVRMVIDIGGQDSKAIKMDEKGKVIRYFYNDKCASGTGRFLEVMAEAMEIPLDKMGEISAQSTENLRISNQCVIFAESEVISLLNEDKNTSDIVAALHKALAKRVAAMAKSIGVEEDIVMTGGVAKNSGVFNAMSNSLDKPLKSVNKVDPQIMGALGACYFAMEHLSCSS